MLKHSSQDVSALFAQDITPVSVSSHMLLLYCTTYVPQYCIVVIIYCLTLIDIKTWWAKFICFHSTSYNKLYHRKLTEAKQSKNMFLVILPGHFCQAITHYFIRGKISVALHFKLTVWQQLSAQLT